MNVTCTHTIDIETKANGFSPRPLSIVLRRSFDIEWSGAVGVIWTPDGDMCVKVMAGDFELFEGDAKDLGGSWMGKEAANALLADDFEWDITNADALEMLLNEADNEAHEREHAAGKL